VADGSGSIFAGELAVGSTMVDRTRHAMKRKQHSMRRTRFDEIGERRAGAIPARLLLLLLLQR
jgi:hypothetical protein